MAKGYLGKISAIVSANTADFDGKLSRSAKEVSLFARNVQSNLTSASRQAAKSLEGIYTPLQRFERSLQAAATMKLSFKGFPGMIKDLDGLQQRLNSVLSQRQVGIVLKTTGMSSVSALRDAISGLKSKDIEIITRFGGLDKVRELRDQISSSQPVIDVRVDIDKAKSRVAELTEQVNAAKAAGGSIAVSVDTAAVDTLTGKLTTATAALAGLRKQAAAAGGGSSGLEKIIADIDKLTDRRAKLESKAVRIRGDERGLQSVNRQIDAISEEIESLEAKRAKLSVSTEDFTNKIESAQKLVDRLTAKLEKAKASGTTADVKELEQQLSAAEKQAGKLERKLANTIKVNVGVDADLGELDAVIKNAENAGTVLGKLPALMDALGRSDFSAATDRMRQLQSVTTEITAPLESSVKKLAGLGAEVAGAFQPALQSAQKGVEMISAAIERQGSASGTLQDKTLESYYESVRQKVERTIASIERLNQVSSQIGQLKTGKEFVFEQPGLNEAINKGGDIGNRAAALPAEALRTNPAIAQSLVEIRRLADEAGVAYAKFLAVKDQKKPTGEAQKEVDAVVKKLLEAQAVAEKQIKVSLDTAEAESKATALKVKITALKENVTFTVTGRVQNFDQARGELSRLQGELSKLDATQRAPIARKVVALGKLVEAGDVSSLETVRGLIQQIEKAVGRKLRINLDKEQAQKAADELAASLAKFKESISFTVTGKVQNVEQARSELGRLQSDVDKLSESQKIAIAPQLQALGELVAGNQINDLEQVRKLIAEIAANTGSVITLKLQKDEAEKAATELKARLDDLREGVKFNVTGSFSNASQIEAEVSSITADIAKLDAAQKVAFGKRTTLVIDLLGQDKIQDAAIAVKNLRSDLDQQMEIKVTSDAAQKAVDALKSKMDQVREQNAFVITGRPQNMEQAESRESSLRGDVSQLRGSQRGKFKGLLEDAAVARETGDLVKYNDVLDAIAAKLASAKAFNVKTAEAKKNLDDLKATMDSLKDESNFVFSGYVQNPGQAEAEIKRIIGGMEKLDAAQRQALQPKVDAAISSLGMKDAKTGLPDIAAIQLAASNLKYYFDKELVIKVNKDDAQKSVDTLKASLGSIADKIGDPSQPIDRLRKAVDAANAAIAKMPAGAIKTKLEGDLNSAKASIEAASKPGVPVPSATGIDAAAARVNAIAASATAATPAKATANPLGDNFGTASRSIASLQSNVISLQGSLEKLPVPMQTQFIPAINKVRDAFGKLNMSSTKAEIDAVVKKAAGLERVLSRAGQASKIGGTLGDALNTAAFSRAEKQIGFIRSKLLEVGAAASGPVADAFNKYSSFVSEAAKKGTLGLAATKEQADQLAEKIAEAAVAAGNLTAQQGKAFTKSIGDVGRAGADKFALAMNQAAFAVDDFMSSTGGLEFKLRAVSNNITQLAFILGGTKGLFIGLGAVIAGQAAVGLVKWYNNGRSAEDQTKALNEALARQKSLVEDLAKAFESLGDSVSRGTLSDSGERAADFDKQIREIKKKQQESVRASVSDFDPAVIKERAEQKKLQGKIEKSQDVGEIVGLQVQMEESKKREREASNRAVAAPPPDLDAVQKTVVDSFKAMADAMARDALDPEMARENSRPFLDRAASVGRPGDVKDARDTLQATINELSTRIEDGVFTPNQAAQARKQIQELQLALKSLGAPLLRAINAAANEVAEASRGPAEQIRQAQEEVAEAVQAGLPGARKFAAELDKMGGRLSAAYKKLEAAVSGKDAEGRDLSNEDRERLTREASDEIADLNDRRREMAAQADAFRYERTVDPQRQIDARLGRARGNLGAAGLEDGRIARRMREIENERETIRQRSALPEFQSPEMIRGLQDAEQALNEEAAAIEAATIAVKAFADELNRASEEAKGNLNSAQQRADEARRADLGNSTPQTQEARRQAEADLERQREAERAAQTEIAVERDRLEQQAASPEATRMQQIDEELKSGRNPADAARKQLAEERAAMDVDVNSKNEEVIADVERKAKRDDAAKARAQALRDTFKAARDLGIDPTGMNLGEAEEAIRGAGRGDVADELSARSDASFDEMRAAGFTAEEAGSGFWEAVNKAGEELAAALERQAEVLDEGAARLAEMDAQIAAVPAGDGRETLIREREALKAKMEDDAKASQDRINAARDASTREAEQAKSGERGRELSRTPEQRFKAETEQGLADIQTYFERRAEANNGIRPAGDIEAQAAAEERFRKEREKEARTATSEGRGAELGMTDRDRFRRDFKEGAGKDINARSAELQADVDKKKKAKDDADAVEAEARKDLFLRRLPADEAVANLDKAKAATKAAQDELAAAEKAPGKLLRQALQNQMEAVAPMLKGFQDERQTAALQGPSRAALNVSDVSTSQGASELTRLIRGDDSAKDVNLAELQKQSGFLEEIKNDLKANNPGVLL